MERRRKETEYWNKGKQIIKKCELDAIKKGSGSHDLSENDKMPL